MTPIHSAKIEELSSLLTMSKAKGFLGREFLTWLWFQSELADSLHLDLKDGGTAICRIWIDDRVVLESSAAKAHIYSLRGGEPSQSIETAAALQSGKMAKQLKIGIDIDDMGEFTAVLNAQDLTPRSLSLPVLANQDASQGTPADTAASEPLALRLQQTELFLNVLDALFSLFLDERTDAKWEDEGVEKIRTWIKTRSTVEKADLH